MTCVRYVSSRTADYSRDAAYFAARKAADWDDHDCVGTTVVIRWKWLLNCLVAEDELILEGGEPLPRGNILIIGFR